MDHVRNPEERYHDIEEKIRQIAQELYTQMEEEVPSIFTGKGWIGKIMGWVMRDESFKVQLFRFIDVLPSLKSDDLVMRLLKEYFSEEPGAPTVIKRGIERISRRKLSSYVAGMLIKKGIESLARQFIAGESPKDALHSLEGQGHLGIRFNIDLLGEAVVSDREARQFTERYVELLDFLHRDKSKDQGRFDISLKISSFHSQLDPVDWEGSIEQVKKGLRPIFQKAMEYNVDITFDMEHYYYKGLSIAIFKSILDEFRDLQRPGIALQAYLRDTKNDLQQIIDWAKENRRPVTIRLVKGAYWDYETVVNRQKGWPVPVFLKKEETDRNYEELTTLLIENARYIRPAIATHNLRSISHAIAVADSLHLTGEAFEFQMLYGMAEPLRNVLRKMNYNVKVYAPVGEFIPGMAYLIRRLLENTSDESFLRKSFVEKVPFEDLIKPPRPYAGIAAEKKSGDEFRNEPTLDFSIPENRQKMKDALKKVREDFNKGYPLFLGDRELLTETKIVSVNPAFPDEAIGIVSSASRKEASIAVEAAREAWRSWRRVLPEERAGYLFAAARQMRTLRVEFAALEVHEVGKTWKDADSDVTEAIDYLEYYGREMMRLGKHSYPGDYPGEENEYYYEPRGIGVVISPWNFPLAIPAGMVSAAVVAGNCVIFKPSGLSPVTGMKLCEVFRSSALPPGVLQFLPGPGEEVGEYLISHPEMDFIAFTGSKDVGLRIIELAGKTLPGQRNIKRVIAEMGGKNAIIIDETADLDEAVKGVIESALGYQGQKCSACSRVIVVGDVFNAFCTRLKEAMESVKIGPPADPSNFMGPVIDKHALHKIAGYVKEGMRTAKTLLAKNAEGKGCYVGPTAFTDLPPGSPLLNEEIFGPVLSILRADNIDNAIDLANNSSYALTAGVFSRSPASIRKVKSEVRAGNVYINRKITGALVGRQPFGGVGMSGIGSKAGGPDYLLQFMNPGSVSENTLRRGFAPRRISSGSSSF
jgi:RHH-type proline utilization regulon transcriptional repressor/proline dehydrogenase/delta 1-pyrroline-5-carboxylate dehydrogenase